MGLPESAPAIDSPAMEQRRFGSTELRVSRYGLGCARIGGIFQREGAGFVELLHAARDAGITFFDTADIYSQGESEVLLAKAFRRQRDRIVIASKAGYVLPAQRRLVARLKPLARPVIRWLGLRRDQLPASVRGAPTQNFSPEHLKRAVEASLKRLRTEYIDLLQLHSPPAEVVAGGEWLGALEALQRAGKIRYFGVSCDTVEAALAALGFAQSSALQVPFNLLEQSFGAEVIPRASGQNTAVIARECLANGLLAKRESEIDLKVYCRSPEEAERRGQALADLRRRAAAAGQSLTRFALDFVAGNPGVAVTLIGVSRLSQLQSTLRELPA